MVKSGRKSDAASAQSRGELLQRTSEVVVAFLNKNEIDLRRLPYVLETVFAKFSVLGQVSFHESQILQRLPNQIDFSASPPAIEKSITPDYLICLEDGVRLKTLKRYLFRKYRLTPEQYRLKWGLPSDYPMVAPNYAMKRSDLAKEMGFGRLKKKRRGTKMVRKKKPS